MLVVVKAPKPLEDTVDGGRDVVGERETCGETDAGGARGCILRLYYNYVQ